MRCEWREWRARVLSSLHIWRRGKARGAMGVVYLESKARHSWPYGRVPAKTIVMTSSIILSNNL